MHEQVGNSQRRGKSCVVPEGNRAHADRSPLSLQAKDPAVYLIRGTNRPPKCRTLRKQGACGRDIVMKTRLMLPAMLLAGAALPAWAQGMQTPPPDSAPPTSTTAPSDSTPPAPQPPTDTAAPPSTTPPSADPNANMPTGAVPPEARSMAPADQSVPPNPAAPVGSAANPAVVGGNMTPPPPTPKEYPVCTKTITDSCINPGEGPAARMGHHRRRR